MELATLRPIELRNFRLFRTFPYENQRDVVKNDNSGNSGIGYFAGIIFYKTDEEESNMSAATRILLVDDDPDDKFLFLEALRKAAEWSSCSYCSSGTDALKWLMNAELLPHYIFLDLNMPRLNGKDVLKEIKKDGRLHQIPVIIYSTSNQETDKQECIRLGAALYVTKPYRLHDLEKIILHVFETVKPGAF
jgi:CheY-like chemotaxis protein